MGITVGSVLQWAVQSDHLGAWESLHTPSRDLLLNRAAALVSECGELLRALLHRKTHSQRGKYSAPFFGGKPGDNYMTKANFVSLFGIYRKTAPDPLPVLLDDRDATWSAIA